MCMCMCMYVYVELMFCPHVPIFFGRIRISRPPALGSKYFDIIYFKYFGITSSQTFEVRQGELLDVSLHDVETENSLLLGGLINRFDD